MSRPRHAEIWWGEPPGLTSRPFLVVTRDEGIPVMSGIMVAPVTSTIRGIPSELALGESEGLHKDCVASFDNLQTISPALLIRRMGALGSRRHEMCAALSAVANC